MDTVVLHMVCSYELVFDGHPTNHPHLSPSLLPPRPPHPKRAQHMMMRGFSPLLLAASTGLAVLLCLVSSLSSVPQAAAAAAAAAAAYAPAPARLRGLLEAAADPSSGSPSSFRAATTASPRGWWPGQASMPPSSLASAPARPGATPTRSCCRTGRCSRPAGPWRRG